MRERDDEAVVPAHRLQQLSFFDDCLSHKSSFVRRDALRAAT
jgi:hypothetical protein